MVRDSLLQREEKDPRIIKLGNALGVNDNDEGRLIGAIKKHPVNIHLRLNSALIGDVPNKREVNNNILAKLMK